MITWASFSHFFKASTPEISETKKPWRTPNRGLLTGEVGAKGYVFLQNGWRSPTSNSFASNIIKSLKLIITLRETNSKRPWKWIVGRLSPFRNWDAIFSGVFAVSFREGNHDRTWGLNSWHFDPAWVPVRRPPFWWNIQGPLCFKW